MPIFPSRPGPNKFRLVPAEIIVIPPLTPIYEEVILSSTYNGIWQSYAVDDLYISQGFTLVSDRVISSISLLYKIIGPRYHGLPNFNVRVSIYNSVGGLPTTLIAGSTSVINTSEWLAGNLTFTFPFNDVALSAGSYCFVVTYEDVVLNNAANYIDYQFNSANEYAGGAVGYKTEAGVNWALLAGWDLNSSLTFVTYV